MEDAWYHTDANHQFEESIEFALLQTKEFASSGKNVKWVTLASQNALQCACVFYLDGNDTTQTAAYSKSAAKKWFNWFNDRSISRPKSRLAAPKELFERCSIKNKNLLKYEDDIFYIINLRNQFTHFYPISLSVDLINLPETLNSLICAVEEISQMPRFYSHRFDRPRLKAVTANIKEIKIIISKLERQNEEKFGKKL